MSLWLSTIILAAGQGTRMRSNLPKVLQPMAGRPLLAHVIDCASALGADDVCVVYGHGGETVRSAFPDPRLRWALQADQLGTGHAVQQAMPDTPDDHRVLVLFGDVPLLTTRTCRRLVETTPDDEVAVLTVDMEDPTGYGRIVRDGDRVTRIVEHKDASAEEQAIHEINTGVLLCPADNLKRWLDNLSNDNAQGEYYLTDVVAMAVADGVAVRGVKADTWTEVMGINDKKQLAEAERALQARLVDELMTQGVGFADPARVMPEQIAWYVHNLPGEFSWIALVLALVGGIVLCRRYPRMAVLLLGSLLAAWVYAFNYEIHDVYVFHIPSYVLLALLACIGGGTLADWAASSWGRKGLGRALAVIAVLLGPIPALAAAGNVVTRGRAGLLGGFVVSTEPPEDVDVIFENLHQILMIRTESFR